MLHESTDSDSQKLDVSQYWKISNAKDSIYAYKIIQKDPMVQFFEQNVGGDAY